METINGTKTNNDAAPRTTNWAVWAGGLALGGMLFTNALLFHKSSRLEDELSRLRSATNAELGIIRESSTQSAENARKSIEDLASQLTETQTAAQKAAASAAQQSRVNADRAARRAEELVSSLAEQSKARHTETIEALGVIKQATDANAAKVGEVASEVGGVRTEVATTKSALDATIADLKSVRGDLGVQSGLIATNAKELAALRELGERNYHEFAITRQAGPAKVGGIVLTLKKADVKRNKFSFEVIADDKRVEKKDKTINEPVQFYVNGSRTPYEIVVNSVSKDKIAGYLATPKIMTARR